MKEDTKMAKDQVMNKEDLDKVNGGMSQEEYLKMQKLMLNRPDNSKEQGPQSNSGVTNGGFVGR
jgi:hypothetical protein